MQRGCPSPPGSTGLFAGFHDSGVFPCRLFKIAHAGTPPQDTTYDNTLRHEQRQAGTPDSVTRARNARAAIKERRGDAVDITKGAVS
jgi:hypothetical protein